MLRRHGSLAALPAACLLLAAASAAPVELALHEPGGTLRVSSDPISGETLLRGGVRYIGEYALTV